MSAKEVDIDQLNSDYPCDRRNGYGTGCKCENGKLHKGLIKCSYHNLQVKWIQCTQCKYQRKYIESLNK